MTKRLILLFVLAIILTGCGQSDGNPIEKDEPNAGHQEERRYTLEMYNQIEMGDTYEKVQALLGDPGIEGLKDKFIAIREAALEALNGYLFNIF